MLAETISQNEALAANQSHEAPQPATSAQPKRGSIRQRLAERQAEQDCRHEDQRSAIMTAQLRCKQVMHKAESAPLEGPGDEVAKRKGAIEPARDQCRQIMRDAHRVRRYVTERMVWPDPLGLGDEARFEQPIHSEELLRRFAQPLPSQHEGIALRAAQLCA